MKSYQYKNLLTEFCKDLQDVINALGNPGKNMTIVKFELRDGNEGAWSTLNAKILVDMSAIFIETISYDDPRQREEMERTILKRLLFATFSFGVNNATRTIKEKLGLITPITNGTNN